MQRTTDHQVSDCFLVVRTPWDSCCLTWSIQMLCILLKFPGFTAVCQGWSTSADESVSKLLKAGRMHQWRMTRYVPACSLKLPKMAYVIKQGSRCSYGWVLHGWRGFVSDLWELEAQSNTAYLVTKVLFKDFLRLKALQYHSLNVILARRVLDYI